MASKYYTQKEFEDTVFFIDNSASISVSNRNSQLRKTTSGEMFKYCFIKGKYTFYKSVKSFARNYIIFTKTGY